MIYYPAPQLHGSQGSPIKDTMSSSPLLPRTAGLDRLLQSPMKPLSRRAASTGWLPFQGTWHPHARVTVRVTEGVKVERKVSRVIVRAWTEKAPEVTRVSRQSAGLRLKEQPPTNTADFSRKAARDFLRSPLGRGALLRHLEAYRDLNPIADEKVLMREAERDLIAHFKREFDKTLTESLGCCPTEESVFGAADEDDGKDTPEYNADPELIELAERMNLPVQDLEEFREVFSLVDIDRGGSISTEELGTLMETLGVKVTPDELEAMVADVDENGNGEIDFDEFVQVMCRKTSGDHSPEEVKAAFKLFAGPDGPDGTITLKDLQHALMSHGEDRLSEEEARELCSHLDHTDGRFNYRDYVNMTMDQ
ncbi:Calcium binding protein [Perkinsus olseni]|nr:Calcium binding protein [Perkinsus olseni]